MTYTLPSSIDFGNSTGRGLDRGVNLYHTLMQHAVERAKNKRAEEMQPYTIKHIMSQINNANAANSRAQGMYPEQLKALQNKNDPNYEINNKINMIKMLKEKFGRKPQGNQENTSNENNNEMSQDELMNHPIPHDNENPLFAKLKSMGMFGQQKKGQAAQLPEELRPLPGDGSMTDEQVDELERQDKLRKQKKNNLLVPKKSGLTDEDYANGEMIKSITGYNPYPRHKETPEEKRDADFANKKALEEYKTEQKKIAEQQKIDLANEDERKETIKTAKADIPKMKKVLDSLKIMKEIAETDPDLFGHTFMGFDTSERFARTTDDPNAGTFQTEGVDPIVSTEMNLSSKGNVPALKFAIANKPNFAETQPVALAKINASIDKIEKAIEANNKISGTKEESGFKLMHDPETGKNFKVPAKDIAARLKDKWSHVK